MSVLAATARSVVILAVLLWFFAPEAGAFPITVQPGGYVGQYTVQGQGSFHGPATVDLPAGTHLLTTADFGILGPAGANGANYVRFTVDGGGQVTAVTNPVTNDPSAAATASGSTLVLNNAAIIIDPGAYTGAWATGPHRNAPPFFFTGARTLVLIPEMSYPLGMDGYTTLSAGAAGDRAQFFWFSVDAGGQIAGIFNGATQAPSNAATASGSTLAFRNVSIAVDPGLYTGSWATGPHRAVPPFFFAGSRSLVLVPELSYPISAYGFSTYPVAGASGAQFFWVSLDELGQIAGVFNGATQGPSNAATAGGSTLSFRNAAIAIDPGAYAGTYALHSHRSIVGYSSGPQSVVLVPELTYLLVNNDFLTFPAGGGNGATWFNFAVDAGGQIATVFNPMTNGPSGAAVASGSLLSLRTMRMAVDPGTYAGTYVLGGYSSLTGPVCLTVMPTLAAPLVAAQTTLGAAFPDVGVVVPPALPVTISGEPHIFRFSLCDTPVANAGPDQTVPEGSGVTLDGSASSPAPGSGASYQWAQLAGPAVALDLTADPVRPTFVAPQVSFGGATVTFQLTVSKDGLSSEPDSVNITVANVNHPPVADTGAADQIVNEGTAVTLHGETSYDPDGDTIASYAWTQTGGSTVPLTGAGTANPTFTAPEVGGQSVLTFQLIVGDGALPSAPATATVTVENVNHAPLASASSPTPTVNEGGTASLSAQGSVDPDGDTITYAWTQTGGPAVTLSDPAVAAPAFTAPQVAASTPLTFELVVSDGQLPSAPAQVVVTVVNVNRPVACAAAAPSVALLWPPNHRMIPVAIVGVTDPDNDQVSVTITGVTQDEPVNGLGDGDTGPDAAIQGATVLLRAERAGSGNGRVYRVGFTADDGQGGACSGSVLVGVPRSMRPGEPIVDGGALYTSTQP